MTQHTPGPWRDWTDPEGGKWVTHGDNSRTICRVTVKDGLGKSGQYPRDLEGIANARLIAAAPDLLLLVEAAYDRFTDNDFVPPNYALQRWLKQAEATMAAVTGETP